MEPHPFLDRVTPRGYVVGELSSLLQKAIRRGRAAELEALLAATELDEAGLGNYVFRRLRIIASEDIGLADPLTVVLVRALYENYLEAIKTKHHGDARLFLVHAVLALVRGSTDAPGGRSRIIDNATNLMYGPYRPTLEIPSWALDHHCARGRALGRTERNSYEVSYGIADQRLRDDFVGPAHPWMTGDQVKLFAEPHTERPAPDDPTEPPPLPPVAEGHDPSLF